MLRVCVCVCVCTDVAPHQVTQTLFVQREFEHCDKILAHTHTHTHKEAVLLRVGTCIYVAILNQSWQVTQSYTHTHTHGTAT